MSRILILFFIVWRLGAQQLEIHYINVGWGGSVFVRGPDGTSVLMEAGETGKGTTRVVPYLQHEGLFPAQGLDYTIAGHQHCDHIGGFPEVVNAGYNVHIRNYYNGSSYPSGCVDKWNAAAANKTTAGALVVAPVGGQIPLGNGARLTFIARNGSIIGGGTVAVSDENDRSIAVLIQYGGFDYLWASDLGGGNIDQACTGRSTDQKDVETSVIQAISPGGAFPMISGGGIDVLHVNHHGSESSTNRNWMNLSRPAVAVIGVGAGQNTGWDFPRAEVVERVLLSQATACITAPPARVLQTEEGSPIGPQTSLAGYAVGNIKISTDGVTTFTVAGDGQVTQGPNEVGLANLPLTLPLDDLTTSGGMYPGGQALSASNGSGSINLTLPSGFAWSAFSNASWLTLTGATSGTGSGTLSYQVIPNPGTGRSATITVAGLSFAVEQQAASIPGLNLVGSLAHLAGQENWTTSFTLVNRGGAPAQMRLSLFGDPLDPTGSGPLMLPLAFPQQATASGPLLAASFDRTLAANSSLVVNTAGSQTPPVLVGSAQLATTGSVDGFAIFHHVVSLQEAVIPLETRNANSYLLAFDNTGGLVLGVAVANVSAQNANISVVIRDDNGVQIADALQATISLVGNSHTSFVLSALFPVTANRRGTIEFKTPAGGRISVLGLRFTPPNDALTTIPALANVGTGGGSIAHLASGGDGWQTTFVLVNTGTSAATATLSFFADGTGAPLSLPLTFPQGNIAATTASFVTQTLAAGAALTVQSTGAPDLLTGSAQLSTNGNVSGFVIFRHNGQEAVVPLESRNTNAYILAFDNTNDTFTGVALNAVSAQQVNVPVVVRNDAGTQIASGSIMLAANGHSAFTIGVDKFPEAASIRGTIEFGRPANAQIGALGIRIPPGAAHTFTTLPALAK